MREIQAGKARAWAVWVAFCCMVLVVPAAWALSGNAQVTYAGNGQFDELATAMEAQSSAEPMKVADWHTLCYAYFRVKRYNKIFTCLDQLDKALVARDKRTRLFGLEDATPTVHIMRAETNVEIGQFSAAVASAQRAIDWFKQDGGNEKDILIQALAVQALAYKSAGQLESAQQAAAKLDAVPMGFFGDDAIGAKSLAVARVSMALGLWQKTLDALAQDKTLALRAFMDNLASGAFLRGLNNWVWIELPRGYMQNKALLELGRIDEARKGYDALLKIPQIAANGEIHWMILSDRSQIAAADGDSELSRQLDLQALDVIERQRASINTEANKIGFIGDKQSVYARLVTQLFLTGRYAQALAIVERAKSRALVDLLASKANFAAPRSERSGALDIVELINEQGRAELSSLEQSASSMRATSAGRAPKERTVGVALPSELQTLLSVSALREDEIQALLAEDEAMLSYFSFGSRLFALVVRKDKVVGKVIDSTGLENEVRVLRESLNKRLGVDARLRKLYTRLVGPVEEQLQGSKRLTIVAHGVLHYLPFSALHDGSGYLGEKYSLRMLPSASVLKYLRPTKPAGFERVLVLGNPDLRDPAMDLPGAQAEAQALAKDLSAAHLLLRDKASKEAFLQLAPQSQYIHIASHGEFDASNPLSSGLLLAAPSKELGRLTVSDLYQLQLDAELVTLSACETGIGRVANGDDIVGLTRGFLYAGTSSVLASLWQVDDDATTLLMTRFYHHLATHTRDEALKLAQLDAKVKYPNPFFWASFYLTGSP